MYWIKLDHCVRQFKSLQIPYSRPFGPDAYQNHSWLDFNEVLGSIYWVLQNTFRESGAVLGTNPGEVASSPVKWHNDDHSDLQAAAPNSITASTLEKQT